MKVFNFDPKDFVDEYASNGYVHIPSGVAPGFLEFAQTFTRDALQQEQDKSLAEWAFKNKKIQFLFDFPHTVDFRADVKDLVGKLAGLDLNKVTLCERHVKVYDDHAPTNPPAHKDRVASQVTVGIPLQVPENSYIVIYPHDHRDVNLFASTALHRASLGDDELPEKVLADIEPVKLHVWPGDVIFFKGSSMYHERVNPANTSLLYLKFNDLYLDPLGEDPSTPTQRQHSLNLIDNLDDNTLLKSPVVVSPRLEKISRHYTRWYWKEIIQLNLWNEKEVSISEQEFALLKSVGDGHRTVAELLRRTGVDGRGLYRPLPAVRRLIRLGALNLVAHQNCKES